MQNNYFVFFLIFFIVFVQAQSVPGSSLPANSPNTPITPNSLTTPLTPNSSLTNTHKSSTVPQECGMCSAVLDFILKCPSVIKQPKNEQEVSSTGDNFEFIFLLLGETKIRNIVGKSRRSFVQLLMSHL